MKKQTTYKIENLPFMFLSRTQYGPYTIFENGGDCILKIKTEFLDKNKSIVNTQQFSKLEDLISRAQVAIEKSGKTDQIVITIDDLNSIVISDKNAKTKTIVDPTKDSAELEMKGALKNLGIVNFGLKELGKKVKNAITKGGDEISLATLKNAGNKLGTAFKSGDQLYGDYVKLSKLRNLYFNPLKQSLQYLCKTNPGKTLLKYAELSVADFEKLDNDITIASKSIDQLLTAIMQKGKFKAVKQVADISDEYKNENKKSLERLKEQLQDEYKRYKKGQLTAEETEKLKEKMDQYNDLKERNMSEPRNRKNFDDTDLQQKRLDIKRMLGEKLLEIVLLIDNIAKFCKDNKLETNKKLLNHVNTILAKSKKSVTDVIKNSKIDIDSLKKQKEKVKTELQNKLTKANNEINDFVKTQKNDLFKEQSEGEANLAKSVAQTIITDKNNKDEVNLGKSVYKALTDDVKLNGTLEKVISTRFKSNDANKAFIDQLKANEALSSEDKSAFLNKLKKNESKIVESILGKPNNNTNKAEDKAKSDDELDNFKFSAKNVYGLANNLLKTFAEEGWVKDSENGRVYQDKFGTQWSSDQPDATPVFESKDGKANPKDFKSDEGEDSIMSEDEMDNTLGLDEDNESSGDDFDLGEDESNEEDDLDLGEESDDDLDLGGDDLGLDDEGSEDELFSEDDDLDSDFNLDDTDLGLEDNNEDEESSDDNEFDLDSDEDDLFGENSEEEDSFGESEDDLFGDESKPEPEQNLTAEKAIDALEQITLKVLDKLDPQTNMQR